MAEFGKYDLLKKIGAGGMAEVFLARSFGAEGLEKLLVIKKILPAFSKNRHFVSMFIDEAKIAVTLSHPNIVQIFEFGQVGRDYYLAMEHIEGVDLGKLISYARRQQIPFPAGEAVFVCMELAKGLDYAHRKKDPLGEPLDIVHRDVSPQNLLIAREGAVKIVDFGIAKARSITEEEGVVKGKFAYMPPEQARGGRIDHRSDLFAAGVILYELLVGRSPYGVPGAEVNAEMVSRSEIIRPREIMPDLSQELDSIVVRALARDPEARYQSARDLQLDLTRYLYSRGEIHDAGTLSAFYNKVFPEVETNHTRGSQSGAPSPQHPLPSPLVSDVVPGLSTPGSSKSGSQAGEPSARMIRKGVIAIHGAIRGFTDLRRSHGEDKVRGLMLDYLRILENIAFKSEAIRERVAEDGFTLLLGLPIATAQDPERAIRLAFDLLDATEGINRNVDPLVKDGERRTHGLKISIGISRAEVRTEANAGRQLVYEVEPGSLDLVQALGARAEPNEIRCSSEIWRATRRAFRFQETHDIESGRSYTVEGSLSRAERIREGSAVTLYGRDLAKKALRDVFREVLLSNQSRTLMISGEIGIGKSALVRSFLSELDPREIKILQGACLYYDVDIPFSPLIELLRDLIQIGEADPIDVIQQKLEAELRRLFGAKVHHPELASLEVSGEFALADVEGPSPTDQEYEYILHSFGPLLGIKYPQGPLEALDAEQRKMRTTLSIQRLFARLARRKAVVIVLEDLHWADSLSLEILEAIAKERYPRKILVVLTTRPTERAERLMKAMPVIELGELELEDRRRLVGDVFGEAAPRLQDVAQQIAERVGGNPLFLRETAESVIERGDPKDTSQAAAIPTTIWGVVAARLDELKTEEREALRWASAIGGVVSPKLLEMAAGADVAAALPRLAERTLLMREGDGSFAFRNEITRTVAYEGLPPEERRGVHSRIFQALMTRQNAGAAINPAHLAHHAAQAGEVKEAVRLYQAAADRARETYSNREALRLYERALSLLPQGDPERFPIHLQRSRIYALLSRNAEREDEVAEMLRIAERQGDPLRLARANVEGARLESDLGRRPQAQKALEVALRTARQAHDIATEAEAVRLAAELFTDLGDIPRGLTLARRALEIIGHDPSRRRLRAFALKTLGVLLRRSGNVDEAISIYLEALPLAQEANDRALQGQLYNNVGVASQVGGRFEDSLRYFKQGLAIDQEIGNRYGVGLKLGNIGQIYLQLGDFTRALKYLQQAQQIHEAIEQNGGLADALTYLARVFLRLTAPRDARAYAERALKTAKEDGSRYFIGHAQLALAECLLSVADDNDRQRAFELSTEAARLGEAAPMPDIHAGGLLIAARAQAATGNLPAAREAIHKAVNVVKTHPHVDGEEEVYLHHALLMRGADDDAAQNSLTHAYEIVQERASRLSDLNRRRSFLEAPPNRDIIAAWQRLRRIE